MRILSSSTMLFESFVNSEEYQTIHSDEKGWVLFESFVNSEEYQTMRILSSSTMPFESFVNSEEYQTVSRESTAKIGLTVIRN